MSQKSNALYRAFMAVPLNKADAVRQRLEALGVTKSTMYRDLRVGANNIPSERLSYWADALGTTMQALLDPPQPKARPEAQAAQDAEATLSRFSPTSKP